jgi:hypothetical protein
VERLRQRFTLNDTLADETDPALSPPRTHSPSPTGESRDSGGVAQSRAMSVMEAALLEMGGDSDGMAAYVIKVRLGKMNAMKAAAATEGSATPVRQSAPVDLSDSPASAPCPPSPGSSAGSSYRESVKLTAKQYGEMSIEDAKEDNKTDKHILSKVRHAPPYGVASELIRHLRQFELAPEGVCGKPWHEQFNNLISVMISHNPHLAVQLKWALRIIMALDALNPRCTID